MPSSVCKIGRTVNASYNIWVASLLQHLNWTQDTQRSSCKTDFLNKDFALRLLVLNYCDHLCVIHTRLCTIAMPTIRKFDRHSKKAVGGSKRSNISDKSMWVELVWARCKWRPRRLVGVRLKRQSGEINPCYDTGLPPGWPLEKGFDGYLGEQVENCWCPGF